MIESWSYSQYSAAVKCLKYFKLVYVDKLVQSSPASGDLCFGSALHSAINAVLTGGDGEEVFRLYWNSYKEKDIAYGRFDWGELASLGAGFISKFERLHAKKYRIHTAEKRLYAGYKGIKFEGTVDFYGEYNGRASLRDFKTSGYNYDKSRQDCSLQLSLYSYLVRSALDERIDTVGYTVFNKGVGSIQDLTWEFDEKKMYKDMDNLVDYLEVMDRGRFPANLNSCVMGSFKCSMFEECHGKRT